jgi:hypothetical protein
MAEFQEDPMTASTKTNASTPASRDRQDDAERPSNGTAVESRGSEASLAQLARAHEELTHEIRQLVAGQALDQTTEGDDRERTGRMVTVARTELLGQLREQEQEQARGQLEQAARSADDAVDGVIRSVTTVVRALVPAALVRPEDLVEAAYTVADQGLRVTRRLALSMSSGVRSLTASA